MFADLVRLPRFDQPPQLVQTLFIARAPQPVDAIAAEITDAVEVVDLHSRNRAVVGFAQQKDAQVARYARRIERNAGPVPKSPFAIPIDVNRYARPHVETICGPVSCLSGASEPDGRVHPASQIRSLDRNESGTLNRLSARCGIGNWGRRVGSADSLDRVAMNAGQRH